MYAQYRSLMLSTSSLPRRHRELHRDPSPAGLLALDGDLPTLGVDQPLDDAEAQAAATLLACAGLLAAVEALEEVGQVGGGDARAGVEDAEAGLPVLRLGRPHLP